MGLLTGFRLEYFSLLSTLSFLGGAEGIIQPLLVKAIFDEGVVRGNFPRFMFLTVTYVAFGLFVNLLGLGADFWRKSLDNRILSTLNRRMLESFYRKDYAPVLDRGSGYFVNAVYGDLREGVVPLLGLITSTVSQCILMVSLLMVLLYLSWRGFLLLAGIIPISVVVGTILGRRIKTLTLEEREEEGEFLALLNKSLEAFRIVKGFNFISRVVDVASDRLNAYLLTIFRTYRVSRLFQAINDSTRVVTDFFSLFVGALLVLRGALSFGGFLAFVNTFWRAVTTLLQVFNRMADFHRFGVIANRIASFLAPSRRAYYIKGRSPSVKDLEFAYGDRPVVKDFSLQLDPGEQVVVVGPNGSGKTTLANILSGYLSPSKGDVVLPERVSSITLPIVFPPLRVKDLVDDTYLLSMFELDDHEILEAPADELSAGQQQKVAIALALSRTADLYLIDEPLANLDRKSREIAIKLILEKTKGKSLVVIMHGSEEYHKYFDRIIKMDRPLENVRIGSSSDEIGA